MEMADRIERDFPSLAEMTYLNTAAEGIPPRSVLDALNQYSADKLLGMDGRQAHEQQRLAAAELLANMYGMATDEVSFCSCSSEAYNLTATALRLQPGDEVVVNDLDFPAGATPWMQASCPATARVWRARAGRLDPADLRQLLGPRTRLVTTSLVSFYNGFRVDIDQVVDTVRAHSDALVALDVTQALGRVPLDLRRVDLVISSTHKWILATHGGGLVGLPRRNWDRLTSHAGGWFHLEGAFEADRFDRVQSRPGAISFSVGMPNYPAIYAIRAGLQYIHDLGIDTIARHADPLVDQCLEGLRDLDVELLTPPDRSCLAGILAFRHPRAEALHQHLHANNVHVMSHAGRLRVAIHFYNTPQDIDTLLRCTKKFLRD